MTRCLSRAEAARHCGVSETLFDATVRPYVPPIRLGRRVLWDIRALDAWLDAKAGLAPECQPVKAGAYEAWKSRRHGAA